MIILLSIKYNKFTEKIVIYTRVLACSSIISGNKLKRSIPHVVTSVVETQMNYSLLNETLHPQLEPALGFSATTNACLAISLT